MTSRGLRNNNPGNIRLSSQKFVGEINGTDKSFKTFKNMAYGYRALMKILLNYQRLYRLNTVRKIIGRWAPENENDTRAYVNNVARGIGVEPDTLIDLRNRQTLCAFAAAISKQENGVSANLSDVEKGYEVL
jgi:hypothetical protein